MRIAISGASGFVGSYISRKWVDDAHEIIPITRIQQNNQTLLTEALEDCDVLVNLSGSPIIGRWNEEHKELVRSSRINTTHNLVRAISEMKFPPKIFISASAIGIYLAGQKSDERNAHYGRDFLAKLVKSWEAEALKAEINGIRTVIFRLGIVLGEGGALKEMLGIFQKGLGGILGNGKQYMSWVHIEDVFRAFDYVVRNEEVSDIINLTSPNPVTNKEFTKTLAKALKKPAFFRVPAFALKLRFKEGANLLLDGQEVYPRKLSELGFEFEYESLEDAINNIIT